jgi:energy-coupling factor transporter ATP-binding protein EcfA2
MLELHGLTRRYGDLVALDDLSFTVREGQMFGFVGPNGAGKTTAMRIVLGVLEPDRGEVRWRGRPVDAETRRRFGYMPEDHGQTFRQCASFPGTRSSCRPASPPRAWALRVRHGARTNCNALQRAAGGGRPFREDALEPRTRRARRVISSRVQRPRTSSTVLAAR